MLSDSLRQRLEALNRDRLPAVPARPRPVAAPPQRAAELTTLHSPRVEGSAAIEATEFGEHALYTLPVAELWPKGPGLVAGRLEHLSQQPLEGELGELVQAMPGRVALLDLETCGLSGAALFLVGLLRWVDNEPTVELLFARSYAEEAAVLASLWRRLNDIDVLVTFNGKSFDWPMVVDRSRRYLLHKKLELPTPRHVDMLHHARRKYKAVLPDCKLQTIESQVCRRPRGPDIPGSQIPAAYDNYVRTGRDDEMRQVRQHNALDLVTLLDITMRVAS
ncbi:hypothetical protein Pla123a_01070 [Posidoniimonas polymericola]|uniref:YprB ribonuclease H-like domain-containing protein n=1 Tax=Posidoniimonas polymericola TaxID=2528002 RepID=A0A5C5ZDR0_9BACT|nr:ribonuclease H-like domain-containing protein [Posidoniimonas polymericola]TWT85300.1 hypothetical protein Pla123a_01070 [Posidoniimonas polymericola]